MTDSQSIDSALVQTIDPLSPDVVRCPYAYYKQLQDEAPVIRPPGRDFFLVTRHEDVTHVLRRPDIFSADYRSLFNKRPEVNAILMRGAPSVATLATLDPPEHQRFRNLVNRAFTPGRVENLTAAVEEEANKLIDAFEADGTFDAVDQFAVPYTMSITADQLGVPREDIWKFKSWSDARVVQFSLMTTIEKECQAAEQRLEFQQYFTELFNQKRAAPTNDMISVLATTKFDDLDRGLTVPEFLSVAEQLMTAGNLTTTHAFTSAMHLLLTHPEQMSEIMADLTKIRPFIEEVLRLESPASGIWRLCKIDTELSGTHIPAGSAVHVRLAAANRDPRRFPSPEKINLSRDNLSSHVAFGNGAHFCIGSLLARRELEIGFRCLLQRLGNMRLRYPQDTVNYIESFTVHGIAHLFVNFDPPPLQASYIPHNLQR